MFRFFSLPVLIVAVVVLAGVWLDVSIVNQKKLEEINADLATELNRAQTEIKELKAVDQYKRNEELQDKISKIEKTYKQAIIVYENIDDLSAQGIDITNLKKEFINSLKFLADLDYKQADDQLTKLTAEIDKIKSDIALAEQKRLEEEARAKLAAKTPVAPKPIPAPVVEITSNTPPADGQYSRQLVDVGGQRFTVSIIAGNLSTTKVIVDTSFATECDNDCPLLSLSQFAQGNNAFAGVNGSYFCPASYPSCVGKANTFEFLAVNKDGTYFNESEIGISSYPAVIFWDSRVQFISTLLTWTKDSNVKNLLTNYPLLVSNYNLIYTGGSSDVKITQKGNRSFVANIGQTVYIGTVHNSSMTESARVLHALGMENALNLDDGGSTALWYQGSYKLGPGRNLPNVILFIKK